LHRSGSWTTAAAATTADPVLDDALDLLSCPHCAGVLTRSGGSVTCTDGHSFDVARSGYLSLLPGDAKLGSADTAEMVAAREAFLAAGHFEPLAEALAEEAERALGGRAERRVGGRAEHALGGREEEALGGGQAEWPPTGCVLDLGAGTGWYLAAVLDRLPGRIGLALDLSKHALRRAARAHPRIAAVACDAWRPLPVRDDAAALVLSVFAPRNGPEIARVLRPGGALLVVTPTGRHLAELIEQLGLLTVDERKDERLAAALDAHLDLERRVEREWTLDLAAADVANAVAMGPSARHVTPARHITPGETASRTAVSASVAISTYRRTLG
jgi:23S rRNA (guanine745-N1)-methyltransferase